ncbi:MAG: ABC transporter ATP-binding protein [Christensenellaceae bacterium]|nr:ABC transporter ATP-binding protein [Christensenellaceae bacterium]
MFNEQTKTQQENVKKKPSNLKRFISYYKPHKGLFILDMVCALFISAVDIVYPLLSKTALNKYLLPENPQYRAFFILIAVCIVMYILRTGATYIVTFMGHRLGVKIEADMRRDAFSHLQKLGFSFYDKSRTGKLLSRCTNDLFDVTELAHHGPEDVFISVVTFIGAFTVMAFIEWRLAVMLIAIVPLMLLFVMKLRSHMNRTSRKVKEGMAIINADIESSISGARVAKAFTNEKYEISKFEHGNGIFINSKTKYYKTMGTFMAGMEFFTSILNVLVLGLSGYLIMRGKMELSTLVVFLLYISSFVTPIRKLSAFAEQYTMGMAGFKRFTELLDTEPDVVDSPDAVELSDVKGNIVFDHVSFAYGAESENVLEDICLNIKAGKTLALVGPSGGGKTTLCHLLPRFYDITSGHITIDGHEIHDVTLRSLRQNIGIVQQDVFLFAASIKDNIRYGNINATDEDIINAAIAAEIHDDIMQMPDGYDTVVGERGITLSGGQKQRVSIARIFLKNPPILILDEATSALDSATEARITAAFEKLSKGRTTLVIAHRLSTVRNADEIAVVDEHGIVELGSHDELMALNGEYRALNDAQNKFYIIE